jgi:hypothetical protein
MVRQPAVEKMPISHSGSSSSGASMSGKRSYLECATTNTDAQNAATRKWWIQVIRVLRILEYVYEDFEQQEEDMKNWTTPAWGARRFGNGVSLFCAMMPPTTEIIREQLKDTDL